MTAAKFDVLGFGNAIVDVFARTEDDFLVKHGMNKGSMALIDEARAETIYQAMGSAVTISGGSAANTIAGVASFGGRGAFGGKVKKDALGDAFAHDIRNIGVTFTTPMAADGPATARSFILVTPDGERTMNTYLGAAQNLTPADVDEAQVKDSAITYLEGYLWDPPEAKKAFVKAAEIAHAAGRKVSLTLSDAFCVDRYRGEFRTLVREKTVDILFANEIELKSLYETADFDAAVKALQSEAPLAAVTRSELGCVVVTPGGVVPVPAFPIPQVTDTTGAGDLFAAGFLLGVARAQDHETCARLGALAAAEVIQHIGARPQRSLKVLAAENGLAV
ncbi:putative sugar kinase YdjH [Variibacter gotjawalensis]|uniref:Putative sugar kinase YdjH n=1 Tax=Variibacter gotjawalensis TaxID=1333996 RepID=A0A0S3PQ80_9BRAD|nr:adenosine kinase [Variibacter gotjawalensis]NIK48327.1 adenosine kinase [Variibacter gotjawalensis]RZS50197.1 sugar/nucleoside kinase (ribokinase family) [Variibacter gotjawalensis]BAT58028.1 putative sugar kinase YdjH [Variibacter gotjawalensis]